MPDMEKYGLAIDLGVFPTVSTDEDCKRVSALVDAAVRRKLGIPQDASIRVVAANVTSRSA